MDAGDVSVQTGYGWDYGPTTACKKCGDDASIWDPSWWEDGECKCVDGRTGPNCELVECASTTPTVSLGFLLLEVQWPRHARVLSRNEAFSGISAAFRAADANSDNLTSEARASVDEAGAGGDSGRRHGGAPGSDAHLVETTAPRSLDEDDVTITEMIQDELDRLETQQTKEFYEQPGDSGAIAKMTATYPNPQTEDKECENQNEKKPILEWTVDRGDNVIFQQCAFFNGARLASDVGWDDGISSGGTCNDVAAGDVGDECSYTFDLGDLDVISHHHHQDLWPADNATVDVSDGPHDLGEIATPDNWELSFTIKIDDGGLAFDDKWNSIIHVADSNGQSPDDYYPAPFFTKPRQCTSIKQNPMVVMIISESTTVFEAGKTYDIVVKNINSKISIYVDGKLDNHMDNSKGRTRRRPGLLKVGWSGGKYPPAAATISNARFAEVEALVISKHSYCVETKFCPPEQRDV